MAGVPRELSPSRWNGCGLYSTRAGRAPMIAIGNGTPASTGPASALPASLWPASLCPASLCPASVDPASMCPASPGPASMEPASAEPASTSPEPASTVPASPGPASTEPASTEPASVATPASNPVGPPSSLTGAWVPSRITKGPASLSPGATRTPSTRNDSRPSLSRAREYTPTGNVSNAKRPSALVSAEVSLPAAATRALAATTGV